MRKDTYRIGDGTFAFSPAVFDSLLGHGAKGAARMRELAGAMHVSISSIKDWRRGTHAPSDFEKVEDIACWAHIDVADLLIESGDRTMDEKLTENQLDVLCVLWNQAYLPVLNELLASIQAVSWLYRAIWIFIIFRR